MVIWWSFGQRPIGQAGQSFGESPFAWSDLGVIWDSLDGAGRAELLRNHIQEEKAEMSTMLQTPLKLIKGASILVRGTGKGAPKVAIPLAERLRPFSPSGLRFTFHRSGAVSASGNPSAAESIGEQGTFKIGKWSQTPSQRPGEFYDPRKWPGRGGYN